MEFDQAITKTGYGKFHIEVTLACALCIICVGFQNGLSAYIFPAAQCDLKLASSEIGFLNVAFLSGGILSAFLWGILADNIGRRKVLIFTHLTNATVTVICAINPYFTSLIIARFLNGFLIGAPGSIVFSYLAEFQPPKYRTAMVCYCGIFFTASWLLLPLLAWAILPINISYTFLPIFSINSWRLFYVLLALPEFIVGFWFFKLPESPKYFIAKGNAREALKVLGKMFMTNTGLQIEDFPVKNLLDYKSEVPAIGFKCKGKLARVLSEIWKQFKSLFKTPLVYLTMLMCVIMFTNMMGIFGLGLWLPELFTRFHRQQNLNTSITQNMSPTVEALTICSPRLDGEVIFSTVAMGIASIFVSGVTGWVTGKVPLRVVPAVEMLAGGVSSAGMHWATTSLQYTILASIFQSTMLAANMSLGGAVVSLFPTTSGGLGICMVMMAGRMGAVSSNLVFGELMDGGCQVPLFLVAGAVLLGAGLCLALPEEDAAVEEIKEEKEIEISVVEKS